VSTLDATGEDATCCGWESRIDGNNPPPNACLCIDFSTVQKQISFPGAVQAIRLATGVIQRHRVNSRAERELSGRRGTRLGANSDPALLTQSHESKATKGRVSLYRIGKSLLNEQERHEGADAPRRSLAQVQSDPEPPSGPEGYCQKYEGGPPPHPLAPQRARSWYKTRNRIVVTAVVIVILVVLGAIIGGAMEGTRRNGSSKDSGSSISQAPVASDSSTSSTSMARPGFIYPDVVQDSDSDSIKQPYYVAGPCVDLATHHFYHTCIFCNDRHCGHRNFHR